MIWERFQTAFKASLHNYLYTMFEGGQKSSRPNLRETRDKQLLGRYPDRSWCQHHTTSMIKFFLVAAHGYNRRETRDKRPLGRDPVRSWCHRHTSVKAFLVAAHGSMNWVHSYAAADVLGSMGYDQESFYTSMAVTSAPNRVPTQRILVPSFTSVIG